MERTDTKTHNEGLQLFAENPRTAKVRTALGFRRGWKPNEHLGETLHYVTVWTQHELNDIYVRTGGTVTTQLVTRTQDDATWPATKIILTVPVPGVGDVQIVTDWDADSGGIDLPIMQAVPVTELIA